MTSDTHGPTQYLWMGVIKRQRNSSGTERQSRQKMVFSGGKAAASREHYKRKHPITLATKPFDHTEGDQ